MSQQHYGNRKLMSGTYSLISGCFQITYDKKQGDESGDESEEEEQDRWSDFQEIGSKSLVKSRVPKERKVQIKDDHGKTHTCNGKFPFTQVFWKVSAKVNKGWLRSAPVYSIRTDGNVQKQSLVIIFLTEFLKTIFTKENTANSVAACFDTYCRVTDCRSTLTFINLEDILKKYVEFETQKGCCLKHQTVNQDFQQENHSSHLKEAMLKSELCTAVLRAASHPNLLKSLSSLLPYSFDQVFHKLEMRKNTQDLFWLADEMVSQRPWEFMFRDIIYAKLKLHGTESTLVAYENAGYLSKTPQTEKDAIYIYETLKTDARRDGNTYVSFKRLLNSYHLNKLNYKINGEHRWTNALEYLEKNNVIRKELFNGELNIFLRRNWEAEVDIVNGLECIIKKHQEEPLIWDIDDKSPDFARINMDPEQKRALKLIASSPVTILSGKGGCGKTTVITTLLKHIYDQIRLIIETDSGELYIRLLTGQMHLEENQHAQKKQPKPTHSTSLYNNLKEAADYNKVLLSKNQSEQNIYDSSAVSKFSQNKAIPITDVSVPSSSSHITDISHSLDSSNENPSNHLQNLKQKISDQLSNSNISKDDRLRKEIILDLLKIVELSKDKDHPFLIDFKKLILLTAPTGKAAKLLGSKANLNSATLHSVIKSWEMYKKALQTQETKTPWNYSKVEVLVVDECSLLSVSLFATVMNILVENANLKKIILLGDIKQLPSIDPGNFLTDVFNAFGNVNNGQSCLSLELTSNHRSESDLIIENAGKISHQKMPTFNEEKRFHLLSLSGEADDNARDEKIRYLLKNVDDLRSEVNSQFVSFRNAHCMAVNELCCHHYNQHSIKAAGAKTRRSDFQVGDKICFGKNALVPNCQELIINRYLDEDLKEVIAQVFSKNSKQESKQTKHITNSKNSQKPTKLDAAETLSLFEAEDEEFDKTVSEMMQKDHEAAGFLQTAKTSQDATPPSQQAKKSTSLNVASILGAGTEKLCNGEVFFIMDEINETDAKSNEQVKYLVLSDKDPYCPRVVCVPFRILRRACKMRHSWARTIHTFQGSECDTVVYVLGAAIPQNWQHVYTAITRGKKSVYIIGKWEELHKAISRKDYPRRSRLRHRLEEIITTYKKTLLAALTDNTKNKSILQRAETNAYSIDQEQDFEDSIENDLIEGRKKYQDINDMSVLQNEAQVLNNLNQEIYQNRNNREDLNIFLSFESNEDFHFNDEEIFPEIKTNFTPLKEQATPSCSFQNHVSNAGNEYRNIQDDCTNYIGNDEDFNISDEELVFAADTKINVIQSKESETAVYPSKIMGTDGNACKNYAPDKINVKKSKIINTDFTDNESSGSSKCAHNGNNSDFTPPKVRRLEESSINSPFQNKFRCVLKLEETLAYNKKP